MDNKENNFLDPKTLMAIVMVGLVWFGWQSYLSKKYPNTNTPAATADAGKAAPQALPATSELKTETNTSAKVQAPAAEQLIKVESSQASFQVSSQGLGLQSLLLKKYSNRDKTAIQFGKDQKDKLFSMGILGQDKPLDFDVKQISENVFEGTASVGSAKIVRHVEYDPETFSFSNDVTITNAGTSIAGFYINLPEKKEEGKKTGFLSGNYDHQEFYASHDAGKTERVNISSAKEKINQTVNNVTIASVASQYFASALVDKSDIIPSVDMKADGDVILASVSYKFANTRDQMKFSFKTFAGPLAHDILTQVDAGLPDVLNFGYFSGIGKILLGVLKFFNKGIGNWGLSIILLTLLVRLLVLPFNVASYRSMKRMQKIQPAMKSLRERYKDDPTALQRETMALMKTEKVNPLGGCLPMLLQMPIFFAFFSVLGHSIELYQAPFFGWISDLSLKDPFYVLPVLVGIVFFIQQKSTPSTMDPAQAKVMQFMPIIFSVMMLSLPSGLNLYTFISTLFGVSQQRFFMRDRNSAPSVSVAKA